MLYQTDENLNSTCISETVYCLVIIACDCGVDAPLCVLRYPGELNTIGVLYFINNQMSNT